MDIDGLSEIVDQVSIILGDSEKATELKQTLKDSLLNVNTYGKFVFRFINNLFGSYGLIVINMDDHRLKKHFAPIIKKELLHQVSKPYVTETQTQLAVYNFKAQAFARDINLFYLGNGGRERIEKEQNEFAIVGTEQKFTESEILSELEKHPENFSPNVVMRPIYQEFILPSLAYIGGGGEIAYWLERKTQFEAFDVFYPMLIRRNSVMIVSKSQNKQVSKLGFSIADIFQKQDRLIDQFLSENTDIVIDLKEQKKSIEDAYQQIAEKSAAIDIGLSKSVLSSMTQQLKSINQMESRIKRALKSQQEVNVSKIRKLKETLFPNNGLQERHDNFMAHYIRMEDSFFNVLIDNLDPLDRRFTSIIDE